MTERVVLDTNILISGLLWPNGSPGNILGLAISQRIQNVVSPLILRELSRILSAKFRYDVATVSRTLEQVQAFSELFDPPELSPAAVPDPADNAVIACAVFSRAGFLVTGDAVMLAVKRVRQVRIVPAREMLTLVR